MDKFRTGPKFEQASFSCNIDIRSTFTHNGRISDRAEIRTPNFQLQYLLQFYSKNLTIVLEPVNGLMLILGFYKWNLSRNCI